MKGKTMVIASLRGVSKSFRGTNLFADVDYDLERGVIQALQGANGSGKSVLLKVLCGFIRPDAGTVTIDPEYLSVGQAFPQGFGVIIDRPGYLAGATGYANLERLAEIRGVIGKSEIHAAMERVRLDPGARQKVRNYSLGMRQRLALAQTFMEGQQVLILDEPFNALDAGGIEDIRDLLREFRDEGRTILFTSHQQDDIDVLADVVHRINRNRLEVVEQTPQSRALG